MAKKIVKESKAKKPEARSFFERFRWELIIFAFSAILYANSIPNDYNMDDELVTKNHRLTSKGISAIPEIFTTTYYKDAMGYAYEYRPMVLTSFAIEHQIFGDKPPVSHFINVLLYGLCCILLFRVLKKITLGFSVLIPLGITLLFVAHPAHTEVVSSIKNRDEILGLLFSLLTWLAALRAVNGNNKWLVGVLLFFIAAVMSKLSVLPFNLIIPLAILLFTDAGFKKVITISLLLSIATFIVLNTFLYDKVIIATGMIAATMLLYTFIHFRQITGQLKSFFASVVAKPSGLSDNVLHSSGPASLKEFFHGVTFHLGPYLAFQPIAATLATAMVFIIGTITGFPLLIAITGAGLLGLLIFGNERTKWWAQIAIYVCLVVILVKYNPGSGVFTDLFTLCVVYQIFYGNRKLFIPSVLLYASLFFLQPWETTLGVGVIALIAYRWRWTWPMVVIFIAGGLYSSFLQFQRVGFFSTGLYTDNYGIILALMLIISLWLGRGSKTLVTIFQVSAIAAFLSLNIIAKPLSPAAARYTIKEQISSVGKQVNTNIVSDKVDRPIVFVEQPVTVTSPLGLRLGTAFEILFIYLHKVVLPYPMSFYYGYQFIEPEHITQTIPVIGLLLYAALFLLTVFCLRRYRLIGFGLMIYLISIASVSTFFFPIPGQLGERFLFIPSLGWSIVLVIGLITLFKFKIPASEVSFAKLPNGLKYPVAAILCLYSVMTVARNFDWKDYTTLSKHDISYVENSSQANNLLALNLMQKSYEIADPAAQQASRREALQHFRRSLELYPQFYNVTYDLARAYNVLNENDSAVTYFKRALALDSTNPNPALFAGEILNQQGKYSEAIPYLEYASRHSLGSYQAFDKLSFAYFKINNYNQSIAVNLRAIATLPPQPAPYTNIARVYIALNQMDSARVYLQKALPFNPNDQMVQSLLKQSAPH